MAAESGRERARASLLDRLIDLDPGSPSEVRPLRTLTKPQLRESVRRDLEWLLNTRCPVPAPPLAPRARTVLDYGLPDFSALSPRSTRDQSALATAVEQALAAFEPRLRQVRVQVRQGRAGTLDLRIEAALLIQRTTEPVSFTASLAGPSEPVVVEAG